MMGAPIIQVFIFALIPLLIRKLSYCLWHSNLISVWIILSRNTIMSIVFTFVLALFYGALPDFGSALLPSFYKLKYKLSIWFPNFFELACFVPFIDGLYRTYIAFFVQFLGTNSIVSAFCVQFAFFLPTVFLYQSCLFFYISFFLYFFFFFFFFFFFNFFFYFFFFIFFFLIK